MQKHSAVDGRIGVNCGWRTRPGGGLDISYESHDSDETYTGDTFRQQALASTPRGLIHAASRVRHADEA